MGKNGRLMGEVESALYDLAAVAFYLSGGRGGALHLSKMASGISHVSINGSDQQSLNSDSLLVQVAWAILSLLTLKTVRNLYSELRVRNAVERRADLLREYDEQPDEQGQSTSSQSSLNVSEGSLEAPRCILCLSPRLRPSCTPCGHVFCWSCIHEAVQASPECPVCRETIPVSRIVPMMNFV